MVSFIAQEGSKTSRLGSWIGRFALLVVANLAASPGLVMAQEGDPPGDSSELHFAAQPESPEPSDPAQPAESSEPRKAGEANLVTPQACVEHFVLSARQDHWREAALALDFRLLGDLDEAQTAQLAERFFFVLNQELWIDWDRLPDRPDGLLIGHALGQDDPMAGKTRRSIRLGTIDVDDRAIPINIHRLKATSGEAYWHFSAHTVDNIDALWQAHGPSWLAQQMPSWARHRWHFRLPIWQWCGLLLILILAPLAGYLVGTGASRWCLDRYSESTAELCLGLKWPVAATISSLLAWLSLEWILGLPGEVAAVLEPLTLIIFVSAAVWLTMRIITFFIDRVLKREIRERHGEETVSRKRLLTQVTVARHVILLVLVLLGIAVVLLQLDVFRTIGVTMLTSAGALAVILSIAGRAVLGNLIAGLQIALAQPFRIGDTILVEDNWGRIEDITYVDVIVRTWDERRLVFPVGYFINHWFENWSKTDPYLIKAIYLQVDYGADVDKIRDKFIEIVKEDDNWLAERNEPEALVTDFSDETMTVRLTCGAADPSQAWSLACNSRERLIRWLQDFEGGRYLPRRRVLMESAGQAPDDQPSSS